MLQSMRSKIKGLVAFFLIALLTIPLALVGVESFFNRTNHVGEAATVDGVSISEREVQIAIGRERQRLQSQYGETLPADFFADERLREPVIDSLVQQALLSNLALEGKMTISEAELDKTIVSLPDFQVDGVFNQQRFVQIVRSIGYTPLSFRVYLKNQLLVDQLQQALATTGFITEQETDRIVTLFRQTRDFSWVTLPLDGLPEKIAITADEVSARYEENKEGYLSEEQVSIEYIDLNVSDLESDISIGADEIRQQFEQILSNHKNSAQREAAHIMIEGDDEVAQEKIATVQEKLSLGEDFSALAAEYSDDFGTRDNGGNLGVSSGDVFPEAFEDALLNLTQGQVSEPTTIDGATHFIKLVNLTETLAPEYEDEKVAIEADLRRVKAEEQFIKDVQAIEELSYNAESLEEVGQELGLVVGKTALFSRTSTDETIVQDSRVMAAVFSEQVLLEGHSSNLLALSANRNMVIKKLDHKPVRTLTLDEKRSDIVAELQLEQAKARLVEQAKSIREALDQGQDIVALSEEQGLLLSSQEGVARDSVEVPNELLTTIFALPKPVNSNAVITERHLDNGDYVLASLTQVVDGNLDTMEASESENVRASLSSNISGASYRAWQNQLRDDADVEVFTSEYPAY